MNRTHLATNLQSLNQQDKLYDEIANSIEIMLLSIPDYKANPLEFFNWRAQTAEGKLYGALEKIQEGVFLQLKPPNESWNDAGIIIAEVEKSLIGELWFDRIVEMYNDGFEQIFNQKINLQ